VAGRKYGVNDEFVFTGRDITRLRLAINYWPSLLLLLLRLVIIIP